VEKPFPDTVFGSKKVVMNGSWYDRRGTQFLCYDPSASSSPCTVFFEFKDDDDDDDGGRSSCDALIHICGSLHSNTLCSNDRQLDFSIFPFRNIYHDLPDFSHSSNPHTDRMQVGTHDYDGRHKTKKLGLGLTLAFCLVLFSLHFSPTKEASHSFIRSRSLTNSNCALAHSNIHMLLKPVPLPEF
jgi:hypothetical protein